MTKNEIYFILADKPNIFSSCESNQQSKRWQRSQNSARQDQNKHSVRATKTPENKTKQYQCGETGRKQRSNQEEEDTQQQNLREYQKANGKEKTDENGQ